MSEERAPFLKSPQRLSKPRAVLLPSLTLRLKNAMWRTELGTQSALNTAVLDKCPPRVPLLAIPPECKLHEGRGTVPVSISAIDVFQPLHSFWHITGAQQIFVE